MHAQHTENHFIGRHNELVAFSRWLSTPGAPSIFYLHDATEEVEKKGGVGKTWLLRKYAEMIEELQPDSGIVTLDFFNIGDRDRIFLAEKVVTALQDLYPFWTPGAFREAIQHYREETRLASSKNADPTIPIRETATAGLAEDLQRLDAYLHQEQKTLFIFFDTYEMIEQNPAVAVLRPSQTFPDTYQYEHVRVVMAGRNRLDWNHPNWRGRKNEVEVMELEPFSQQEMQEYLQNETFFRFHLEPTHIKDLYERTEGRPILIGLAADVLNHHILSLEELIATPRSTFEEYLIPQVNQLEDPLNWIILFMAHAYHRFNIPILEKILTHVQVGKPFQEINQDTLLSTLPTLSFIRRPNAGNDFVLHDEMRRLVTRYCWERQDPDHRFRKEISQCLIDYLTDELQHASSQQQRQQIIIETLYHRLFISIEDGLRYFQEQFQPAVRYFQTAFARLLLQETQQFKQVMTPAQNNELQLAEARLLRTEDNAAAALELLHTLEECADSQWLARHQTDLLMEKGRSYTRVSKMQEAIASYEQCLTIERAKGNDARCAHLLNNLGLIYRRRGQLTTAETYYEQSIALYKKLGLQNYYAYALTNISTVLRLQGKVEEALRRCKIGWRIRLDLAKQGKESEVMVGQSLSTLGVIYLHAGNIVEAERCFKEAYDIYLQTNYKIGIALIYNRFGQIQLAKGDLALALDWFEKAQHSAQELDAEQYINSLNKQGRIYTMLQEWNKAIPRLQEAIALAREIPDDYQQTESLIDLANIYRVSDLEQNIETILQEAEAIATRENYLFLLGKIAQTRGEIYYHSADYHSAFTQFALFCHFMARHNNFEFGIAIRRVYDAIIGLPNEQVQPVVATIQQYWEHHHLNELYPALPEAISEIEDLMAF